jgi:hypothetical protein
MYVLFSGSFLYGFWANGYGLSDEESRTREQEDTIGGKPSRDSVTQSVVIGFGIG